MTTGVLRMDTVCHRLAPQLRGHRMARRDLVSDALPCGLQGGQREPDRSDSADRDAPAKRHPLDCYKPIFVMHKMANACKEATPLHTHTTPRFPPMWNLP